MHKRPYVITTTGGWSGNSMVKNYKVIASSDEEALAAGRQAFREETGLEPRNSWVHKASSTVACQERN